MKVELTIKVDYLPNWGVFEGVRELLQNAKDAETEFQAPMSVRVREQKGSEGTGILVIENEGCTMPYEALLLGHTSKGDRSDLIGKFGEGFKLGILALIRAGHEVKIRNGSEVWLPEIAMSDKFKAKVLVFNIMAGRKDEKRIQIEVHGISPEVYRDEIKPRFLWLDKDGRRKDEIIETPYGSLLLSDRYKGRVFVKGIFVEHKPELTVGYDFLDCEVDRDRKMVQTWDFQWKSRTIWSHAMGQRPDLFGSFLSIVEANGDEAKNIDAYAAGRLPSEFIDHALNAFTNQHGKDAVPVSTLSESKDLEHLGRRGVVVPIGLKSIIEHRAGPLTKIKDDLKNEVVRTYSWHELSSVQKENLERAVEMVNPHQPVKLDEISIHDFRSPALQGLYSAEGIKLAGKVVSNNIDCLATLVHEVAHRAGGDGEKGHVEQIERIWSCIVKTLLG